MSVNLSTGRAVREAARRGDLVGQTSGLAPGYVQANLVILPADWGTEFADFCSRNPQPCPVLERLEPGNPLPRLCTRDADLRTDLPRYRVWRSGELIEERTEICELWQADWESFLIGCSFTFEAALIEAGIPIRHLELGCNVPMYRTCRPCHPAGRFHGPLVVSMRPVARENVDRAIAITSHFPRVHGAPVHVEAPEELGIEDLDHPDFGSPVPMHPDEVPVFWACGVTPQAVLQQVRPPLAITHSPGCMFFTDWKDSDLWEA